METSSDDSSDSVTRQKSTKPLTSSNKSSTFLTKHKYDNEETPLKQPHQEPSRREEGDDLHYRVLGLNESSTEDDTKKSYQKLALRSHTDKNKHPQASAVMRMINEAKQGLEDVLRHNDATRRTQEREEDLQRQ